MATFALIYALNWSFGAIFVTHKHQTISLPPYAIPINTDAKEIMYWECELKNNNSPSTMKQFTMIFMVTILVLSNNLPQAYELNIRHPNGIVIHANVSKRLEALIPYAGLAKYSVRNGFVI